ncbi:MAG: RHS repeat-associated core domain-containing protein, partial [Anaerolineae bacterium]|nr:RHS repeat-associated core domain-containing protein [Anaerolineae bacterium]
MQQQVNGQTTNYLWDEFSLFGDVVLESDGGGALLASYTLGNGRMLSQSRGGVPSYYLQDGQGSTRALTDASGAVTDSSSYTAFGETYSQSSATPNTYLYTGQQYDAGTGLYNLRARYYNPGLGRFLSRDSAEVLYGNPVELNRYAYAANNPVNYYDPSGNISLTWGQLNRNSVKAASIAFPPVAKF